MVIVDFHKTLRTQIIILCPQCRGKLYIVGITDTVLWCDKCKQAYVLNLMRTSRYKEEDLKDVVGFPDKQE